MNRINCYIIPLREVGAETAMATITETQTIDAELTMEKSAINLIALRKSFMHPMTKLLKPKQAEPIECNIPDCPCKAATCPPNCTCKQSFSHRAIGLIINAIGLLIAILATYMIITTDSKLYLVFWIAYSVLRRMMGKSRKQLKVD